MKENLRSLQQRHHALVDQAQQLHRSNEENWTPGLQTRFDGYMSQAAQIREQIDRREGELEELRTADPSAFREDPQSPDLPGAGFPEVMVRKGEHRTIDTNGSVFETRRRIGWDKAGDVDLESVTPGAFLRAAMLGPRSRIEERALSEGSASGGGYTVPNPVAARLIDLLANQVVVRRAGAQVVPMFSEDLSIPKVTSAPTATWQSEGSTHGFSDAVFDRVLMTPYVLRSETIVSRELLSDNVVALESALQNIWVDSLARSFDQACIVGASTAGGPTGIYESTGVGTLLAYGSTAASSIVDYRWILNGVQAIDEDNASRPNRPLSLICSPRTQIELAKLKATDDQPMMVPPMVSERVRILPTNTITNDYASGGSTDTTFCILGDFARFLIGERMPAQVEILRERHAGKFSYGFLAASRLAAAWEHDESFRKITNIKGSTAV